MRDFQSRLAEKTFKRQFKLNNRVGGLGRQGIHGPVEQAEKRILRQIKIKQPHKPKG